MPRVWDNLQFIITQIEKELLKGNLSKMGYMFRQIVGGPGILRLHMGRERELMHKRGERLSAHKVIVKRFL